MSIGVLDVIERLPFELQARLEADDYFSDIVVVVAEEGNVQAMVAAKQAVMTSKGGKTGAAVIVLQVVADDDLPEVAFGPMTLRPAFQVVENLELNRGTTGTGKSARRIARRLRDLVKPLALVGLTTEFVPGKPCIYPVALSKELGALVKAYQVDFHTWEADDEGVSMCERPEFSETEEDAPEFQIACATAGAAIWFTTDDSYPRPSNPAARVYSSPVAIPDGGVTVRACAYLAGFVASQVARGTISVE